MRAVNLRLPTARRILDFGCGTGWLIAEAETAGNPYRVGVDHSMEALQGSNGGPWLQEGRSNPTVGFVLADGLNLPFGNDVFDVVIGHVSMPYVNTYEAMREIHRVLVPGGCFFLTFHSFSYLRRRLRQSLERRNWKDVLFVVYIAINGLLNHVSLPQTQVWWKRRMFETVNTAAGVYRTALKVGFIRISTDCERQKIFFASTGIKPDIHTECPSPVQKSTAHGTSWKGSAPVTPTQQCFFEPDIFEVSTPELSGRHGVTDWEY